MKRQWLSKSLVGLVLLLLLSLVFLIRHSPTPSAGVLHASSTEETNPTVLHVDGTVFRDGVKRLGVNLGGQNYYDSEQILRNLITRNPGFEGEEWQSILECAAATPGSCTDNVPWTTWPEGFLDGATYEVILGAAKGQTGTIVHSHKANEGANKGFTIEFAQGAAVPAVHDVFVVRKRDEGTAGGGWWTYAEKGASITVEHKDLSPSTVGSQALRVDAGGNGQFASVTAHFDTTEGHSFVQMKGPYHLQFRARAVGAGRTLSVDLKRSTAGAKSVFSKAVTLSPTWQDYDFRFNADEQGSTPGQMSLVFSVFQTQALLDDVVLAAEGSNGTVFRDEVVTTLRRLRPGVLRYMDGEDWGCSLDNLLAPPGSRQRCSFNKLSIEPDDVAIGLHEFLVLADKLGAEPWFTLPMGTSEQDTRNLMEYLGGPATTPYGAKRAALGHPVPWTKVFSTIHLEYGNEAWNTAQAGAVISAPTLYATRATAIFQAMRASPWYSAGAYDLIVNSQAVNPYMDKMLLAAGSGFDTVDVAPYLFNSFNDYRSAEAAFGPMLAEPEMIDSAPGGYIRGHAEAVARSGRPLKLAVYESNIATLDGSVDQKALDEVVPSIGGGIASGVHMLLMLRDLGITVQNTFTLAGFRAPFRNTATQAQGETSPVYGMVVDMGGPTNRVRPAFLAEQLTNEAILPVMLTTSITGANPTWIQPLSTNDKVQLAHAHELQTFAFTDGTKNTLIIFNLSRTTAHTVRLAGKAAPRGTITVQTLTASRITDSNEKEEQVKIQRSEEAGVSEQTAFTLSPFSMTLFASIHSAPEAAH